MSDSALTVVPGPEIRPDTLPTDRLTGSGRPRPELREELREIPNLRNVVTVAGVYLQSFGLLALAIWVSHPAMWIATFFLMGRAFALYAILAHEAAHRLLFTRKAWNDGVGRWLLAAPAFVPFDIYRRGHMAHHKDEMGPDEPDLALYRGYPITRASLTRKLLRDAFFVSGWKNLKPLLTALAKPSSRPAATRIVIVQAVIATVLTVVGPWWLYPAMWLIPWLTVWRVINRLRAIAEHAGMIRSGDRRETTHHVHQSWLARFWMVPYRTGWHLAHHVDSGIPFRKLPQLHAELVASGWVTPELEYPSYRALWRALAARPAGH